MNLKTKLNANQFTKGKTTEREQKSPLQQLMEFCGQLNIQYFIDDMQDAYARIPQQSSYQLYKIQSTDFSKQIMYLYYNENNKAPSNETLQQLCDILERKTLQSDKQKHVHRRIGFTKDAFYYYLANQNHQVIKITTRGYKILNKCSVNFIHTQNAKAQIRPQKNSGTKELVLKHFRFKDTSDQILFLVYLITCLIPNIPHPILILAGDKGAAKSTSMRMLRRIVDPANAELVSMSKSLDNLAINLENNYMNCYDNLTKLSDELSDLFCMTSTGGTITKRRLYSDSNEVYLNIMRIVTMNGINIVAAKPDFLDRAVRIELDRIGEQQRKPEKEIWEAFDSDLPSILDWCFSTLSKAMKYYSKVSLEKAPRMADFATWGFAIAEVCGLGGKSFLEAYNNNRKCLTEDIMNFDLIANLCLLFMEKIEQWNGTWTQLHYEFKQTAHQHNIDLQIKDWPKATNRFSQRLNEVKSDLEAMGIYYRVTNGKRKIITLINKSAENETSQ